MDKTRITNANKNNYMPAGLRGRAIKEINMDKDKIIDGLRMTMDLCVFDPSTGEEIEPHLLNDISRATYDACKGALEILEQLPPAQPERIKGRWEVASTGYSGFMRCSVCKTGCCGDYRSMKFCPNCGAKMEVTT